MILLWFLVSLNFYTCSEHLGMGENVPFFCWKLFYFGGNISIAQSVIKILTLSNFI